MEMSWTGLELMGEEGKGGFLFVTKGGGGRSLGSRGYLYYHFVFVVHIYILLSDDSRSSSTQMFMPILNDFIMIITFGYTTLWISCEEDTVLASPYSNYRRRRGGTSSTRESREDPDLDTWLAPLIGSDGIISPSECREGEQKRRHLGGTAGVDTL